jgi:hypothetical protein
MGDLEYEGDSICGNDETGEELDLLTVNGFKTRHLMMR